MIKTTTALLCGATLMLSGCAEELAEAVAEDLVDDIENSLDLPPLDDAVGLPDRGPLQTDRICDSHVPTRQATLGNSILAFDAEPGQCFGVKRAEGSGKRLIPTTLIDTTAGESNSALRAVGEARMTINPYDNVLGDGIFYTFAIDVLNDGADPVCLADGITNAPRMSIVGENGDPLGGGLLRALGDQYQVPTAAGANVFTACIPAGETRMVLGSMLDVDADIDPAIVASYDRTELRVETTVLGPDAVRAADLSPVQFAWTASGLEGSDPLFSRGYYPYSVTATVSNDSTQAVRATSRLAHVAYLDAEGFVTDTDLVGIAEFLGKNEDDLTPGDFAIAASGGMLSLASGELEISNSNARADGYRGSATRALVFLRRCFGAGCAP